MSNLKGKRVAVLVEKFYEELELWYPVLRLREAGADADTGAVTFSTTELFLERLGLSSLSDLPDIAPLLPNVDVIDDLSETLDSEPRFMKLNLGAGPDVQPSFDLDEG